MPSILADYYNTPLKLSAACSCADRKGPAGFFSLGRELKCFGQSSAGVTPDISQAANFDATNAIRIAEAGVDLPFDPGAIVDNLRFERYVGPMSGTRRGLTQHPLVRAAYYVVREIMPVKVRKHLQRIYFNSWQELPFPNWPVDTTVDRLHEEFLKLAMRAAGVREVPFIWFWPSGASACLIMTHDVEGLSGRDFTPTLMKIDRSHDFVASFQVVPEKRYEVPDSYVQEIRANGFEFNVHDLNHDGQLFTNRAEFLLRAGRINDYVRKYSSKGFRAGAMYRNQEWFDAFEFQYDMSVPNVAHLEPQRGGCCTVMPYFIGNVLELPLTATQDYSMFHILRDYSLELWKTQIELVRRQHGLISFIAHPDYLIGDNYRATYEKLLDHLNRFSADNNVWKALPGEVNTWWRARNAMKLVKDGTQWKIEGAGSDRASIAFAVLEGDRLEFRV